MVLRSCCDCSVIVVSNCGDDTYLPLTQETKWDVSYLEEGKDAEKESDWESILSVQGHFGNQVTSNSVEVKPNGVYRLKIVDSGGAYNGTLRKGVRWTKS